ncbi:ABC transporter substrate-binding protein [Marinobacterium rhizophilum]|uniref:ABC transporter substrate-binding protein n=2 Tax=Marinobacterium rhizophilum TaxID=420402 RepID=A0ABY5HQN2_9GAMM|nr:ABC transporter substrate-binding protein [Marinobacterium rhizophilum]
MLLGAIVLGGRHLYDAMSAGTRAENAPPSLLIYSATDRIAMAPVLEAFALRYPDVVLNYREYNTMELDQAMRNPARDESPDLVISSAMDLQIRLVNDGFAQAFEDPVLSELPSWANWRNEAFGFSYEPIVFVYNKAAFSGKELPKTHEALATALRSDGLFFQHRVGSYDVRTSGVGYLVASQDEVTSSISGRLQESLGRAFTRVYCCTAQILDAISDGELVLGYNMLGSYALARAYADPRLGVIVPQDYALVVSRVAFIPKKARNLTGARALLRFMLSFEGQQVIAQHGDLVAIHPQATGPYSVTALQQEQTLNFHPIALGPALMVYLDQSKRRRFVSEWQNALLYDPVIP